MINRTYHCPECNYRMEVTLTQDQWDQPPPSCEACDQRMNQHFHPPAIGGSVRVRAAKITEDIIANDYNVANYTSDHRVGGTGKVRYKDQSDDVRQASWSPAGDQSILQTAIDIGKQNRRQFGLDGLDILKRNIMDGSQPDLIEASKRKAIKVW